MPIDALAVIENSDILDIGVDCSLECLRAFLGKDFRGTESNTLVTEIPAGDLPCWNRLVTADPYVRPKVPLTYGQRAD